MMSVAHTPAGETAPDLNQVPVATEINTVEQVNAAYENVKEVDCLDVSKEGIDAWDAACKRSACTVPSHLPSLVMFAVMKNALVVSRRRSRHGCAINWVARKARTRCSRSSRDSTRYSFGHISAARYANIKRN